MTGNIKPLVMWIIPLLFFAYQFILRLWPSLTMQAVKSKFNIDASSFGLLVSFYYYGYATMQIPIAIFLDKFGTRVILSLSAIICGLAMLLFNYTENWYLLLASRLLIGVGSVVGFLGVSKVVSQWFSSENYSKMIGFSFTFGLMGAIYGGKPTSLLMEELGWQNVGFILSMVSIVLGLVAFLVLREPNDQDQERSNDSTIDWQSFRTILKSPRIIFLSIANLLMVGALEGFADVWGVNYMMLSFSLSKSSAAELVSLIFIGMLFGGPILTYLGNKTNNYLIVALCGLIMSSSFIAIIMTSTFNWLLLGSLLFIIGIMCCYQVLVFAIGSSLVNKNMLGITVAFLNSINMLGGSFFHTIIGSIIDYCWRCRINIIDRGQVNIVPAYDVSDYNNALFIIPICSISGTAILLLLKMYKFKK